MRILYLFPTTWLKRHPHRKSQRRPRTLSSKHEGDNTHAPPPTQSAPRLTWPPTNARTDCSGCLPEKVPSKPTIDPANGCTTPNCTIRARSLPSVPSSAWRPHTPCTQSVDRRCRRLTLRRRRRRQHTRKRLRTWRAARWRWQKCRARRQPAAAPD